MKVAVGRRLYSSPDRTDVTVYYVITTDGKQGQLAAEQSQGRTQQQHRTGQSRIAPLHTTHHQITISPVRTCSEKLSKEEKYKTS